MGYKSLLAKGVQTAMKTLGNTDDGLARLHTYIQVTGAGTYDPVSRTVASAETRITDIPMLLAGFALSDVKGDVRPITDRKAIIAGLDLGIVPSAKDRIESAEGVVYDVVGLLSAPEDSVHVVHVRFRQ